MIFMESDEILDKITEVIKRPFGRGSNFLSLLDNIKQLCGKSQTLPKKHLPSSQKKISSGRKFQVHINISRRLC